MGTYAFNMLIYPNSTYPLINEIRKTFYFPLRNATLQTPREFRFGKLHCQLVASNAEDIGKPENEVENPRFKWVEIGTDITEAQKKAIAKLPPLMTKRCKAIMKQIICFSPQNVSLPDLVAAWVRIMKPKRADWLVVIKELKTMDLLYLEVLFSFSLFLIFYFLVFINFIKSYLIGQLILCVCEIVRMSGLDLLVICYCRVFSFLLI